MFHFSKESRWSFVVVVVALLNTMRGISFPVVNTFNFNKSQYLT